MNDFLDNLDSKTMLLIEILFNEGQEQLITEWIAELVRTGEFSQCSLESNFSASEIMENLKAQLNF